MAAADHRAGPRLVMRSLVAQQEKPGHYLVVVVGQEQQVAPRQTLQTGNWPDTEQGWRQALLGWVRAPQRETVPSLWETV